MPNKKKDEVIEPFDYEQALSELARAMGDLHIMRTDEMPNIELYRDQVLSIVSSELAPLYTPDEKIITGSMVNNYVKQQVIPAPSRKRYAKQHLTHLLIVCALKRVLSISQVAQLVALCHEQGVDLGKTYDELVRCLETDLRDRFSHEGRVASGQPSMPTLERTDGTPVTGMLPTLLQAAIGLVANKVYLERLLDLESRRAAADKGLPE